MLQDEPSAAIYEADTYPLWRQIQRGYSRLQYRAIWHFPGKSPVQHLINVLCAVILGPGYGVAAAFVSSLIRNLLGLGTLLAFPGSMCGALLAGILYHYIKKLPAAYIGEVFGTAVIGGMLSYPVAAFIMGSKGAALFTFVVPFLISTAGGTLLAVLITVPLKQTGVLDKIKSELNS